jgi:hypothetical protein
MAVDNLDVANMVVAVAAGNSGPGHNTIESPGSAARALTAGASTVGHFIGTPVTVGGNTYAAASGDFATVASNLTAPLGVPAGSGNNGLNDACAAFPAGSLAGAIALVTRGACTFSTKIRNAQNAGAVAVLVANNVFGDPTAMGQDGTANQPTIPAYMVSANDGLALKALNAQSTTIGAALAYLQTGNDDTAVLRVLPGHVDGHTASCRVGRSSSRPAPDVDGCAGSFGGRQHCRYGCAEERRYGRPGIRRQPDRVRSRESAVCGRRRPCAGSRQREFRRGAVRKRSDDDVRCNGHQFVRRSRHVGGRCGCGRWGRGLFGIAQFRFSGT